MSVREIMARDKQNRRLEEQRAQADSEWHEAAKKRGERVAAAHGAAAAKAAEAAKKAAATTSSEASSADSTWRDAAPLPGTWAHEKAKKQLNGFDDDARGLRYTANGGLKFAKWRESKVSAKTDAAVPGRPNVSTQDVLTAHCLKAKKYQGAYTETGAAVPLHSKLTHVGKVTTDDLEAVQFAKERQKNEEKGAQKPTTFRGVKPTLKSKAPDSGDFIYTEPARRTSQRRLDDLAEESANTHRLLQGAPFPVSVGADDILITARREVSARSAREKHMVAHSDYTPELPPPSPTPYHGYAIEHSVPTELELEELSA